VLRGAYASWTVTALEPARASSRALPAGLLPRRRGARAMARRSVTSVSARVVIRGRSDWSLLEGEIGRSTPTVTALARVCVE